MNRVRFVGNVPRAWRGVRFLESAAPGIDARTEKLAEGIMERSRPALARGITLIESSLPAHMRQAEHLMERVSGGGHGHETFRIGIAGPPGAGKSTFIEKLGMHYISQGSRVAVIAVDPSSHVSGGSILGDKTRMAELSGHDDAYVRASPTRGVLGGIAEHTSDVVFLCEQGGYDGVIVESVGLGQSEVDIERAVDMLLLLVPPGGGDDLQASKKGIMEAADAVIVNKADGSLMAQAKHTKADYSGQLAFIRQKTPHWRCKALLMSNYSDYGFEDVVDTLGTYRHTMESTGQLGETRRRQSEHWMWVQLQRYAAKTLERDDQMAGAAAVLKTEVGAGRKSSRVAARELLELFRGESSEHGH